MQNSSRIVYWYAEYGNDMNTLDCAVSARFAKLSAAARLGLGSACWFCLELYYV